jgi:hypothetical protein
MDPIKQQKRDKKLKEKEKSLKLRKERDIRNNHVTQMFSEASMEAKNAKNVDENKITKDTNNTLHIVNSENSD